MNVAGLVATSGATAAPDISIGHLLLQMVVAMVLVVGGIWGFGKLMGRSRAAGRNAGRAAGGFFRSRTTARSREEGLTILSRQPVGKGKFIAVVQVGGQQFLVGIGDSGLTPLGELRSGDPEPAPDEEPLPVAALHDGALHDGAPVVDFGAAELAALDLSALGVRPLDLGSRPARHAGSAVTSSRATATVERPRSPLPAARAAAARGASARAGAPVRGTPARGGAPARQQPRSMRSVVDALREATVRR